MSLSQARLRWFKMAKTYLRNDLIVISIESDGNESGYCYDILSDKLTVNEIYILVGLLDDVKKDLLDMLGE